MRAAAIAILVLIGTVGLSLAQEAGEDRKDPPTPGKGEGGPPAAAAQEPATKRWDGDGPFTWERGRKPLRRGGSTKRFKAIHAGLDWLVRHQDESGAWRSAHYPARCTDEACSGSGEDLHDVGLTGLVTLAFLGAGEPSDSGQYEETVDRALAFLVAGQDEKGLFQRTDSSRWIYDHLVATLAVTEAYGMCGDESLGRSARAGVRVIQEAQNPYLGWRYGIRDGDNDTSVTSWALITLRIAREAGIEVDPDAIRGGVAWLDKMLEPQWGRVGYQRRGGQSVREEGPAEAFPRDFDETLTAMALSARLIASYPSRYQESLQPSLDRIGKCDVNTDPEDHEANFLEWHFVSLARYLWSDDVWKPWAKMLDADLLPVQVTDRKSCAKGSWFLEDPWNAYGGRVYATSLAVLTLETHARYPRFERPK